MYLLIFLPDLLDRTFHVLSTHTSNIVLNIRLYDVAFAYKTSYDWKEFLSSDVQFKRIINI